MLLVDRHVRLIKRLLLLLVSYSILRLGFYFYHLNIFKQFTQDEIFESLVLGIRFDIAALCLLNLPFLFLALLPSKNSKFFFLERFLFVAINASAIIASLDDYELFLFMGKRLSIDLFSISDDIWDQLPQLIQHYWYFPLMGVLFAIGFYFFDKRYFTLRETRSPWWSQIISGIVLIGAMLVGIRGGLQHKSINVQTAFTQGKNELGHLVLNTPYHFLRTLKSKTRKKISYFSSDEEALNIILNRRDFREQSLGSERPNIVLIILESFSAEYVEKGYTPFLDSLKKDSISFPYHLANGRRSIEALPSLLCGLPSLIGEPISKSMYSGNKFICMPKILKDNGYQNYFFHGGAKGTMGFESYTLSNGFDRYFSKDDYVGADFDGTWGIYDGPFMEFAGKEITKMKEPFLASIFTLSSHQPYSVPDAFKNKFPKGTLEIHESIGYADYALKNFFEKIKNEPWFSKTVFLITADHTSKLETKKYQNLIGKYRVPFLIYSPAKGLGEVDTNKVTQHADIPKTILHLAGILEDDMPATSVSVLGADKGLALYYADGRDYVLVTKNDVLRLSADKKQRHFSYDWDTGRFVGEGESQDPLLKAYIQYFMNGLINNNLSIYR